MKNLSDMSDSEAARASRSTPLTREQAIRAITDADTSSLHGLNMLRYYQIISSHEVFSRNWASQENFLLLNPSIWGENIDFLQTALFR